MITIERTEKEQLMDWLDEQIDFKEHKMFFNKKIYNLSGLGDKSIHVSNAQLIADILGYDVHTKIHDMKEPDGYRVRYFMYKGYEVFNLYMEEEKKDEAV